MADNPWKTIGNRQQDRPRPLNRTGMRSMSQQRPPNMINTTTTNSTGFDFSIFYFNIFFSELLFYRMNEVFGRQNIVSEFLMIGL